MSSSLKKRVFVFAIALLVLIATLPRQSEALPPKKKLKSYVYKLFKTAAAKDDDIRFASMLELEAMGETVIDLAVDRLDTLDADEGMSAAYVLGEIRSPLVIDHLLDILENSEFLGKDEQEDVPGLGSFLVLREKARTFRDGFACLSLGLQASRLDKESAEWSKIKNQLLTYFEEDADRKDFVMVCAIFAMGEMKDESFFDTFKEIGSDVKYSARVRAAGIMSMSQMPFDPSRKFMEEVMALTDVPLTEFEAARIAVQVKRDAAEEAKDAKKKKKRRKKKKKKKKSNKKPKVSKEDKEAEFVVWKTEYLKEHAALILAVVGDESNTDLMRDNLEGFSNVNGRSHLWLSLGERGDKRAASDLKILLEKEKDYKVRICAARAMYQLGDKDTGYDILEDVIYAPDVPDADMVYAVQVVGSIIDGRSRDLLMRLLKHPEVETVQLAVANLTRYGSHEDVSTALFKIAKGHKDKIARQQATLAFSRWELTKENLSVLRTAAGHRDEKIKRSAAIAMQGRVATKDVIKILNPLMFDKDPLVRAYAITAMGTMIVDEKNQKGLVKLSKGKKDYLDQASAIESLDAIKAKSFGSTRARMDFYWKHESMRPKDVWVEFFEHAMIRLLIDIIDETGNYGDELQPEEAIEDEPIIDPTVAKPGYNPISCLIAEGLSFDEIMKTVNRPGGGGASSSSINETYDPAPHAKALVTAYVERHSPSGRDRNKVTSKD